MLPWLPHIVITTRFLTIVGCEVGVFGIVVDEQLGEGGWLGINNNGTHHLYGKEQQQQKSTKE